MAESVAKFSFLPLNKSFNSLQDKDYKEYFLKWSMKDRLKAQIFTFDQGFQAYEKDKFAFDFFRDPNVVSKLETVTGKGQTAILGTKVKKVVASHVPCTILSMAFFDKIMDGNIASESGDIRKCFDEFKDEFAISDNLRQMLLNEDSDVYCEFTERERDEFLFLLFSHMCLGGQLCQFEDNVNPYLDVTKAVYKDLISVQKNPETKVLSIISHVFKVCCYDDNDEVCFPSQKKQIQDFSYLIVDPLKRTVICFYHTFGSCF
ncbi:hypothetical protein BsWGS_03523 [Bradybaena similaris]